MSPIPAFADSGHLPMGRFSVSLGDLRDRFVAHPEFAQSMTRVTLWQGLLGYLANWADLESNCAEVLAGRRITKSLWLGGSFISPKLNPRNIDLTLYVGGEELRKCEALRGVRSKVSLLTSRKKMLDRYGLSPTLVRYYYTRSPWQYTQNLFTPIQAEYAALRGSFDDWWLRIRPEGEDKGAPNEETSEWVRGYLEVIL